MDETEFNRRAEHTLAQLESALEAFEDIDLEVKPGGVLELSFADNAKIIINRHTAAREIWVAAKSGGFHFRLQDDIWVGTRDGVSLETLLASVIAQHSGHVRPVRLV